MTYKEAAIVSVHTGKLIGPMGGFTDYCTELLGKRLHLSEYYDHREELIKLSEKDFHNIKIE